MSALWTPGQRPPGQVELEIQDSPQGSVLRIKGLVLVLPPDGGIATLPMQLESLEGIFNLGLTTVKQVKAKRAEALAMTQSNGSPVLRVEG